MGKNGGWGGGSGVVLTGSKAPARTLVHEGVHVACTRRLGEECCLLLFQLQPQLC